MGAAHVSLAGCRSKRGALVGASLAIAVTGLAQPARSAEGEVGGLRFHADTVEADLRLRELGLQGDVLLLYDRFRLTSPELKLRQTSHGVDVEGPGRVVFCPCPAPPLAVGFSGAIIAPPADLLLRRPQLELFGVTVFALPWFWLRSPTRAGLLPPIVAWRGGDRLLLGAGVHLPWRTGEEWNELDVTGGGYTVGGAEITVRVRMPHSTARLRFDYVRATPSTDGLLTAAPAAGTPQGPSSFVLPSSIAQPSPQSAGGLLAAVDVRGSVSGPEGAAVTWDVDAIRGPRARAGTLLLQEAARAYDRAAFDVVTRSSAVVMSSGVWGIGARGSTGWSTIPAWGPRWSVGASGALANAGAWDSVVDRARHAA